MASAYVALRFCDTCRQRIDPRDPYAVTPGIAADLVECLSCARDDDAPSCETCGEPIEAGDEVYHGDAELGCLPAIAYCDSCDAQLTYAELKTIRCASCAAEEAT